MALARTILLPLREITLFPSMIAPLIFQDEIYMKPFSDSLESDLPLGFVTLKDPGTLQPNYKNIFPVGTTGKVLQYSRDEKQLLRVVIEGRQRFRLRKILEDVPYLVGETELINEHEKQNVVTEALNQSINALLKVCLSFGAPISEELVKLIGNVEKPGKLADLMACYLANDVAEQQDILETLDPAERLKKVFLLLSKEVQSLQVKAKIQLEVAKEIGKSQKDFVLRQQMKVIQRELGEDDTHLDDVKELKEKIKGSGMPEKVGEIAQKELARLERMNQASAEYTVSRTYLDYLASMPWAKRTEDSLDIDKAQAILDEDHHGLEKVKERVLEFLAVRKLNESMKGPILCFVGPPGVGKTSLGMSIARATGRKFVRMSLGGIKDEAEIRGHRRTYVGAMPGRIIQELRRSETNNPVLMLDEVDKLGNDFRGDPASALLEVLDPEQNHSFKDHYLDVPFDLSGVMFITTANLMHSIPAPLRDRMEVVQLSGYTEEEKLKIALQHLVPKQKKENGLGKEEIVFDEAAIRTLIRDYTREAGVRNLEREIGSVLRKCAKAHAQKREWPRLIDDATARRLLGPQKYRATGIDAGDKPGVACGLAWTEAGGDTIFIEARSMKGRSGLLLTGSLGDVMKESAQAALSYLRSNTEKFGLDPAFYDERDIHIHVPQGSIPKDGPSAGITILVALVSMAKDIPAKQTVAMTGELTLSGELLPVGGIKEKVLAALRHGTEEVIIPWKNREDLTEIPEEQLAALKIILAKNAEDVLSYMFGASHAF
ncbi:MAG TPA: endopeptidase La [Syntrophorhabdales bacterium]|nr:endopeptidase La [Syntrophorhabdales bacterium]